MHRCFVTLANGYDVNNLLNAIENSYKTRRSAQTEHDEGAQNMRESSSYFQVADSLHATF